METLCPFCDHRTPAEPDAEWVYCIHCNTYISKDVERRRIEIDPADVAVHLTPAAERVRLLEVLLNKCVIALEALLASPDLNLDCLEQATQDAIAVARETEQAVKMALNTSA